MMDVATKTVFNALKTQDWVYRWCEEMWKDAQHVFGEDVHRVRRHTIEYLEADLAGFYDDYLDVMADATHTPPGATKLLAEQIDRVDWREMAERFVADYLESREE